VLCLLPWAIRQKRIAEVFTYGLAVTLPACLLISFPWVLAIARREPDFWHYFFWVEHIQRFAGQDAQHKAPFWYYLPVLIGGTLPWLALLPGSLRRAWNERRHNRATLYLLAWAVLPLLFFSLAKGKLPTYILPCFAPLSILMARHAALVSKPDDGIFKLNGWINLLFGGSCALAVMLFLAPWGVLAQPLYGPGESGKALLAGLAFLSWGAVGALSLRSPAQRWHWAAACPLGLVLLFGLALPERIVDAKQPQPFIRAFEPEIAASRYILSNNVGLAAGLAWELRRDDIVLFDEQGELTYGLSYPDTGTRFVAHGDFPSWLTTHRREGDVALLLLLPADDNVVPASLPTADGVEHRGRYMLLRYRQRP